MNSASLKRKCMIKRTTGTVAEDGRSFRRSRESTCSYAPGCSSTSVSDSRENSRTVIAFTSGGAATISHRIGYRDRVEIIRRLNADPRDCYIAAPLKKTRLSTIRSVFKKISSQLRERLNTLFALISKEENKRRIDSFFNLKE